MSEQEDSADSPAEKSAAPALFRRFVLFSGEFYYPLGGWDDFDGSFDSLIEAQDAHRPARCSWAHVVDTEVGFVVSRQEALRQWEPGGAA